MSGNRQGTEKCLLCGSSGFEVVYAGPGSIGCFLFFPVRWNRSEAQIIGSVHADPGGFLVDDVTRDSRFGPMDRENGA